MLTIRNSESTRFTVKTLICQIPKDQRIYFKISEKLRLVRKYMDVNEHERLSNITFACLHFKVTEVHSIMSITDTIK